MKEELKKVTAFNNCIGRKTENEGNTNHALVLELIDEEFSEFKQAVKDKDRVGQLDALCDLLYVTFGAVQFLNFNHVIQEAFDRVHASNMSKFCKDLGEVADTIANYKKLDIETDYILVGEQYVVFRVSDKKALKNINYSPVDLKDLVQW